MRQIVLWVLFITCNAAFAQEYPFLSASSKRSNMTEYVDHLNTFPGKERDSIIQKMKRFTEEGKQYTQAYADSIFKTPENKYTTRVYRDTLRNDFSYVLHKRTDAEIEAESKHWNKSMDDDKRNRKKLLGSVIEDLSLTDMDGNVHTLESLEGKIIVIDFWFVNCGSCIAEMPELNKLREKFGTDDIAWFGITFDKKEKVTKFSERIKFDYTLIPEGQHLVDRFGIKFFPTTLVIDLSRKIVYTGKLGSMTGRTKEIEKAIKKVVKDSKKQKQRVVSGPIEKQE